MICVERIQVRACARCAASQQERVQRVRCRQVNRKLDMQPREKPENAKKRRCGVERREESAIQTPPGEKWREIRRVRERVHGGRCSIQHERRRKEIRRRRERDKSGRGMRVCAVQRVQRKPTQRRERET